jgi:hypothetical protein
MTGLFAMIAHLKSVIFNGVSSASHSVLVLTVVVRRAATELGLEGKLRAACHHTTARRARIKHN